MISPSRVTPSASFATLMMPALMPVPSMPTSISRTNSAATSSGVRFHSERGMSRQMPVAAMMLTPVRRDMSARNRTSRPRSSVDSSTIVSTPPSRASLSVGDDLVGKCRKVAEQLGVGVLDARGRGENVLVRQGEAEIGGVERTEDRVDGRHALYIATPL